MTSTTVTSKGQITIPKEIRDYLKLDAGSKIDFVIDADGQVKLVPLNVPTKTLSGSLYSPGMRALSEICLDFGYELPTICTPYELAGN